MDLGSSNQWKQCDCVHCASGKGTATCVMSCGVSSAGMNTMAQQQLSMWIKAAAINGERRADCHAALERRSLGKMGRSSR
jgi:hypothetical protein